MNLTPDQLAELIVTAIKGAVEGPKVHGRFVAAEARLAALEATPSLKFTGTYMDTKTYVPGDAATRQGGLWICQTATTGPFDHTAWQLAVKKGDAR